MGSLFKYILQLPIIQSITRPVTRFIVGAIAIPLFRLLLKHVFRGKEFDEEFETDIEQWFRGSVLLLAATANMEHIIFGALQNKFNDPHAWLWVGLRLLLAIGVVEAMPDQELFNVIHPGPPKIKPSRGFFRQLWQQRIAVLKGVACQHLSRSSPVLAIIAVLFGGKYEENPEAWLAGWICYALAIVQYLIIGLVTSRDRAFDVLSEFDEAVARRRQEIIEEFHLDREPGNPTPPDAEAGTDDKTGTDHSSPGPGADDAAEDDADVAKSD